MEKMKGRKTLDKLMGTVKEGMPAIYEALIGESSPSSTNSHRDRWLCPAGERDRFMAKAIVTANCPVLVGVVGAGHLAGIERNLGEMAAFKSIARNCPAVEPME